MPAKLRASDSVPRVNTKRLRTSLNRYGMLNRTVAATSPVPTWSSVTVRALPRRYSASSGTTVSKIACPTKGTKQAEERQCLAAWQSADRSWNGWLLVYIAVNKQKKTFREVASASRQAHQRGPIRPRPPCPPPLNPGAARWGPLNGYRARVMR